MARTAASWQIEVDALQAEIEEKAEYIAALEGDIADLKRQVAKFDDMAVQFEQGGFDKVVHGLKEQLQGLQNQFFNENADKVSWMRSAKYWKAQALKLGWVHPDEHRQQALGDGGR